MLPLSGIEDEIIFHNPILRPIFRFIIYLPCENSQAISHSCKAKEIREGKGLFDLVGAQPSL